MAKVVKVIEWLSESPKKLGGRAKRSQRSEQDPAQYSLTLRRGDGPRQSRTEGSQVTG